MAVHDTHLPALAPTDLPLLTPEQAAALLGDIPVATIRQYARDGRLPALKIGYHWRFIRSELEEHLSTHRAV